MRQAWLRPAIAATGADRLRNAFGLIPPVARLDPDEGLVLACTEVVHVKLGSWKRHTRFGPVVPAMGRWAMSAKEGHSDVPILAAPAGDRRGHDADSVCAVNCIILGCADIGTDDPA